MSDTKQQRIQPPFWPKHIDMARASGNWMARSYAFFAAACLLYELHEEAQRKRPEEEMRVDSEPFRQWYLAVSASVPVIVNLGYSIELALKALLVQQDPGLIPESGSIQIGHHNLVNLAERAGMTLSPHEIELLTRLRDYIEWGRYPTKKRPNEYVEPFEDPLPFHPKVSFVLSEFCDPLFELRHRVVQEYTRGQDVREQQNPHLKCTSAKSSNTALREEAK